MKLLIVDDHPVLRAGLSALLQQSEPGTVMLEAADCAAGLAVAALHGDLDGVLLDLRMPGADGHSALLEFLARHPEVPVIVFSSSEDPQDVRQALASGARGYVPKSSSPQTILAAFKLVFSGSVYVPPLILDHLDAQAATVAGGSPDQAIARLTQRQLEVLRFIGQGRSNKEICRALDLSEKTVKAHITAIFRTLNVVNRTQAARAAHRYGLTEPNGL